MSDDQTPAPDPAPAPKEQTPPWGDDFDAERAWRLVQNLRADIAGLKTERDTLVAERQERENEGKSDAEKLAARLAEAERTATAAQRELWRERALRKHPLPDDLVDFVVGDTEEELIAKAERLASVATPKAPEGQTDPAPDPVADRQRPEPALVPGHGGDPAAPFDPVAVAEAARKSTY
jgi:hypothetical protein